MALGFLKKAFPFITLAASAGGPLAVQAAGMVGKVLGVDVEPSHDAIEAAVAKATPDQLSQLASSEQEMQKWCIQIGLKSETDFAALNVQDRASARDREKVVRDRTPAIGFYLITVGFFGLLTLMMFWAPPPQNAALLNIMLGSLGTAWLAAVMYYYGSSQGSDMKNAIIAKFAGK